MSVITVIGSGQMGSAMSVPARHNGHEVRLVGTHLDREIIDRLRIDNYHINLKRYLPEGCKYYQLEELNEALQGTDLIIGGVSSFGVDWFCENILPIIPEEVPLLSITKGLINLEDGTLISYLDYYKQHLNGRKVSLNAVGGPCTSYELADLDPTTVCFCGDDIELLRKLREMFRTDFYHISVSTDVLGIECAVAMKNAYALGVSLAVGLAERKEGIGGKQHYNSQAAIFGQSVKEMRRILKHIGVHDDNIIFGAGDLYVTIYGGRTRMIGTLLGRGMKFEEAKAALNGVTLESLVIATRAAAAIRRKIELGELQAKDFPLLLHCDDIINNGAQVNIPWQQFEEDYEI
ncbi:MAG: glycerol-3-phosphate dehydrogenase [Firmicutes bacterium]|nr:glycerol-3-phosphate dehydrogenase [Bacillota bacterium]